MKQLMSLIFLGLYSFSAISSAITSEQLRSLEGEYVGAHIKGSGTCVVKINVKRNKIAFTIESDNIIKYRRGYNGENIPTYSSDEVPLKKFATDAAGSYDTSVIYHKSPWPTQDKLIQLLFISEELSGVALSESKTGLLDFFRPSLLEISAGCYDLKKVR